jgi:hypothetical protein
MALQWLVTVESSLLFPIGMFIAGPLGARHGHGQWVHDVNLGRHLEIILGKDHRTILYNLPDALTYHLGLLYMTLLYMGQGIHCYRILTLVLP